MYFEKEVLDPGTRIHEKSSHRTFPSPAGDLSTSIESCEGGREQRRRVYGRLVPEAGNCSGQQDENRRRRGPVYVHGAWRESRGKRPSSSVNRRPDDVPSQEKNLYPQTDTGIISHLSCEQEQRWPTPIRLRSRKTPSQPGSHGARQSPGAHRQVAPSKDHSLKADPARGSSPPAWAISRRCSASRAPLIHKHSQPHLLTPGPWIQIAPRARWPRKKANKRHG